MSVRAFSFQAQAPGAIGARFSYQYFEYTPSESDVRLERSLEDYAARLSLSPGRSPALFDDVASRVSHYTADRGSRRGERASTLVSAQYPRGAYPGSYTGVSPRGHVSERATPRMIDYPGPIAAPSSHAAAAAATSRKSARSHASSHASRQPPPEFLERRYSHELDEGLPLVLPPAERNSRRREERRLDRSLDVLPEDSISCVSSRRSMPQDSPPRGRTRRRDSDQRSVSSSSTIKPKGHSARGGGAYSTYGEPAAYDTVDITPYRSM